MPKHSGTSLCPPRARLTALLMLGALLVHAACHEAAANPPTVTLAEDGRAVMAVATASDASEEVVEAADTLAAYLEHISGASFERTQGTGDGSIVIGLLDDFADLPFEAAFGTQAFDREDYVLRSTEQELYLIGATPHAVHNAVWDLLYRFGYRQFFPPDAWEIIPEQRTLRIAIDEYQRPDYYNRNVWTGHHWNDHRTLHERWQRRNRTASAFTLHTGHAYGGIIRSNQEAFDENPEFYAKVDGKREHIGADTKFCIANDALRELVVAHAERTMRDDPARDSISMDPSDGSQWCECEDCAEMGSVSDRVVILANEVAEAINDLGLGDKYVGIYAYASHSPPPSPEVEVHPNLIVSISTRFIRGGYTAEELIEQWGARAAVLGLREHYYSYANLPGGGRAANIAYLRRTIPDYHAAGARFNSVNIHGAWGPTGLGHYFMSRFHWDITEAERVDELLDDFVDKAFGSAREPMRAFYRLTHPFEPGDQAPLLTEDLLARMYGLLEEARSLIDDPDARQRLDDLILYTRHVELYHQTVNASSDERQELYEQWIQHSYNMADRMMVHTGRMHSRHYSPRSVSEPDGELRQQMIDAAEPYERDQIDRFLAQGVANNERVDFEPVRFSDDLVPAARYLDLPERSAGSYGSRDAHRSTREFLIWVDEPGEIPLRVTGGLTYQDRGNVRITLYSPLEEREEPVDRHNEVPPDEQEHEVVLRTPFEGLHTVHVTHGGARFRVHFPDDMPVTLEGGFRAQVGFNLYFYVPEGTQAIGGYVDSYYRGLYDGDDNEVYSFEDGISRGMFSVAVPEGQDGRIWRASTWRGRGTLELMTIPSYFALKPEWLLLPREVVEADRSDRP